MFTTSFHNKIIETAYLAVFNKGCFVPINFLICKATFESSSLSNTLKLMNEVGYPTSLSASDTALLHSEPLCDPRKLAWQHTGDVENVLDLDKLQETCLSSLISLADILKHVVEVN